MFDIAGPSLPFAPWYDNTGAHNHFMPAIPAMAHINAPNLLDMGRPYLPEQTHATGQWSAPGQHQSDVLAAGLALLHTQHPVASGANAFPTTFESHLATYNATGGR